MVEHGFAANADVRNNVKNKTLHDFRPYASLCALYIPVSTSPGSKKKSISPEANHTIANFHQATATTATFGGFLAHEMNGDGYMRRCATVIFLEKFKCISFLAAVAKVSVV